MCLLTLCVHLINTECLELLTVKIRHTYTPQSLILPCLLRVSKMPIHTGLLIPFHFIVSCKVKNFGEEETGNSTNMPKHHFNPTIRLTLTPVQRYFLTAEKQTG